MWLRLEPLVLRGAPMCFSPFPFAAHCRRYLCGTCVFSFSVFFCQLSGYSLLQSAMVCGQPWKLTQGKLLVFALRCVCFRLRLGLLRSFCYGPHAHETLVGVSTGLTRTRDFETNVRVHCCSVFVNLLYCKKLLTTVLRWTAHVSSDFVTFYSHLNHLNAFSDLV